MDKCSALEVDCCLFTFMRHLEDFNKPAMSSDGNVSQWMQNLSEFIGKFFKKCYSNADLKALLAYLIDSMKQNKLVEMVIF